MSTILLAVLGGIGCLSAATSAVLLTGQRRPAVAVGGAMAFIAALLVLICAGMSVARFSHGVTPADNGAQRLLDEMIEREVR